MALLKTKDDFPELDNKQFLTINESSALLNESPVTLRRWIKEGVIQTQRISKKHIIKRTDIDARLALQIRHVANTTIAVFLASRISKRICRTKKFTLAMSYMEIDRNLSLIVWDNQL